MKTPWLNGLIDVRLNALETAQLEKPLDTLKSLAVMKPLRPGVNEAAFTAVANLTTLIRLIGCDAEPYKPLLEAAEKNAESGTETP